MEELRQIEDYYNKYDEWSRLERHRIEFEITKRYLNKFVPQNSRILDIGGGPGRYSIYLALKGHKVTLLDLAKKHIDIAREKAHESGAELEALIHGNALKLPEYNLGSFDVILLMGPLYHLTKKADREKVIKDSLNLLKPGGILIASFISAYAPLIDIIKNYPQELDDSRQVLKYLENGTNDAEKGFTHAYFIKPEEAEGFMAGVGLEELAFAGIEGVISTNESKINELKDEIFEQYAETIYSMSQDPHTFASCEHYLYVGRCS